MIIIFEVILIDTENQLKHFIKLLDDESPEIQRILRTTLLNNSLEIILNDYFHEVNLEEHDLQGLEDLRKQVHPELVYEAFQQLMTTREEDIDLEKAIKILAYWNSPDIKTRHITYKIKDIVEQICKTDPTYDDSQSLVDNVSLVLFTELGFQGNVQDYFNADNSFIDSVLSTKKGIPISLSALVILIAKKLNLPIVGVSLPAHFIVKYDDGVTEIFFDPFNNGKIYHREECEKFLYQTSIKNCAGALGGCSNIHIIQRMIKNLIMIFSSYEDNPHKAAQMKNFLHIFNENAEE
jgi:regulator of sirC expression with transglutaminase-like and TPR domain